MSLIGAAEFLEGLPAPCIYLTQDSTIAYSNKEARRIVLHRTVPQSLLQGCRIHDTDFTDLHLADSLDLDRALQELDRHNHDQATVVTSNRQDALAVVRVTEEQVAQLPSSDPSTSSLQHGTPHIVSLSPPQSATSARCWHWEVSRIEICSTVFFCLIAHMAVTDKPKVGRYEMLQHITKPTFDTNDHFITIGMPNLVDRVVDHVCLTQLSNPSDHIADWLSTGRASEVWNEDFTLPLANAEAAIAEAVRTKTGVLGARRGTENPVTGGRTITDYNIVVLNDPASNEVLGCVLQARPPQEWGEFLLSRDIAAKMANTDTMHSTMVRTMMLDGRLDYFSPSWERYSGRNCTSLCEGAWLDSVHMDDLPDLQASVALAFANEQRQEYEVRYRERSSDKFRYFLESIAPWKDAQGRVTRYYCISTDNHELAAQRRAADAASENFLNISRNMDVTVFQIDSNYIMTLAEGAMMFSFHEGALRRAEGLTGMSVHEAIKALKLEGAVALMQAIEDVMEGRQVRASVEYELADRHLRTTVVPIKDDVTTADSGASPVKGVLGMTLDYSAEYDNIQANARIQAMIESGRMKDEFLANISHELRTPIAGLLGLLGLLLETNLTAIQLDLIQSLQASAMALSRIVNDLLDYSKANANAMTIEKASFKLDDVLIELRKNNETVALAKDLHLIIEPVEACPPLLGDALRIRQILHNLLSNAIKFTDTGCVKLSTTVERLENDQAVHLTIIIEDTGIGIETEALERLFKPFVQADQSTTRLFGGTGLGLSIARKLAQAMNGDVSLRSVKGQGTVGTLSLTLDRELGPSSQEQSVCPEVPASPLRRASSMRQANVLVVEDNMINQKVITGILRNLGVRGISTAAHGGEATKHIALTLREEAVSGELPVGEEHPCSHVSLPVPDIVFMDCQMPVVDGFEATRQLRSTLGYNGPIIALTASATQGYREKCLDAGMNDYITKPFTKEDILRTLRQWVHV